MLFHISLTWALIFAGTAVTLASEKEKHHRVKPEEISALIQAADKIVVYGVGYAVADHVNPSPGHAVLYTSSDPRDISELKAALTIEVPKDWFRCACMPSMEIVLFRKDKNLGFISVYEGQMIGFSPWSSDARIQDDFNNRRAADNGLIPGDLKQALLGHSLKSTDGDKVSRARAAFERK